MDKLSVPEIPPEIPGNTRSFAYVYIGKLHVSGYRCIEDLTMHCHPGLNVIAGENNAGKSNLLNALRLPFQRRYGFQELPLREDDFHRDRNGKPDVGRIQVDLEFCRLTGWEKGLSHTCIPAGSDRAQIHFRAELVTRHDRSSRVSTALWGGDCETGSFDSDLLQEFEVVLLGALRDVAPELEPGRRSLIARRLQKFASPETKDGLRHLFDIAAKFTQKQEYIHDVESSVQGQLDAIEGRGPLRTGVDLLLGAPEFRQVASSLRFLLRDHGSDGRWEVNEVGLGYANVLYIAVVLSELEEARKRRDLAMPVVLIEEPEAHLHPQLLQRLAAYLSRAAELVIPRAPQGKLRGTAEQPTAVCDPVAAQADLTAQVFITTHSPILTAGTKLDCLHVLQRTNEGKRTVVSFGGIGLADDEKQTLERYFDATKSQMLFAQGVMLVEGISEALLIPKLAELMGKRIGDHEVAIVNIGGCSFEPFAKLFGKDKLSQPCAIVTDADPSGADKDAFDFSAQVSSPRHSGRVDRCLALCSLPFVNVFMSNVTLEFDLAHAGFADVMARVIQDAYSQPRDSFPGDVAAARDPIAKAALIYRRMLHQDVISKAELAQRVAVKMDTNSLTQVRVPAYLQLAIEHVCNNKRPTRSAS